MILFRHLVCRNTLSLVLFAALFVFAMACRGFAQQPGFDPDHAQKMAAGTALFKSDVKTLLVGRCLKCHGGEKTDGELNLATREGLLAGGASGASIDRESPKSSLLLQLIRHESEPAMPAEGAKLDERQALAIEKWIGLGAPYDKPLTDKADADPTAWMRKTIPEDARDFWIFRSWENQVPPTIDNDNWSKNEIDRFVLKHLKENGLVPNRLAAWDTLVRRSGLDLVGLPPSSLSVQTVSTDNESQVWERHVDSLLDNKHFGERQARHWLDLARFAESFGFEQDYDRPFAYHYRDFVIRAFNSDMPFDQFAAWQIAGDELAPENPEAKLATGLLGAGVFPTQLTEKEFESARYDELDDMVSTLGTTFLGITVGCSRCHDHKFDPVPSRDYYQMVSVFRSAIRSNVEIPIDVEGYKKRLATWEEEHAPLESALSQYESQEFPARFETMLTEMRSKLGKGDALKDAGHGWRLPAATRISSEAGAVFVPQADGAFLATGTNAVSDVYTCEVKTLKTKVSGIRLDAFNDASLPQGGPGRAPNGNIGLSRIRVFAEPLDGSAAKTEVQLTKPIATFEQNNSSLSIASSLDDNEKSGWAVDPQFNKPHSAAYLLSKPFEHASGVALTVVLDFKLNGQHNIGRPRIAITADDATPPLEAITGDALDSEWQTLIRNAPVNPNGALSKQLIKTYIDIFKTKDARWLELRKAVDQHLASKPKQETLTAMICSEGVKPIPNHGDDRGYPHFYPQTFYLKRGDVQQKQGEAEVGFVQALTRLEKSKTSNEADPTSLDWNRWRIEPPAGAKTAYRRASFAKWLTDTEHGAGQQLARVIVNRLWQYHFGQGLVATPSDFGFQGDRPSHPELLDYLAQRLIAGGWRLKPIHKLIMMSATYQQSSTFDQNKASIDPKNRLLWRFSPRRLEAEVIRDSILATSGQLDEKMFGPGTLDEAMNRRSIYFFIKRSQLIPFMQVFDSPEPLVSVGQRPSTTIAPQALMFMNNSQVRRWAQGFAKRVIADKPDALSQQIDYAYQIALSRLPNEEEQLQSSAFVAAQLESYKSTANSNPSENSLADLCQILISLNEFVYLD